MTVTAFSPKIVLKGFLKILMGAIGIDNNLTFFCN